MSGSTDQCVHLEGHSPIMCCQLFHEIDHFKYNAKFLAYLTFILFCIIRYFASHTNHIYLHMAVFLLWFAELQYALSPIACTQWYNHSKKSHNTVLSYIKKKCRDDAVKKNFKQSTILKFAYACIKVTNSDFQQL